MFGQGTRLNLQGLNNLATNQQGTIPPSQAQAIKDAMMKQAMQEQTLPNQQGMMQTPAPNQQGTIPPSQAQAIKNAMMKQAMQNNTPNKQVNSIGAGRVSAGGGPQPTQQGMMQTSASNPYADTSKWSDANWATALEGNLPTLQSGAYSNLTTDQTNAILKKDPNFFINLLKKGDSSFSQTENNNRNSLTNYSGPAFTNTDDVYGYMDSLNIDENLDAFGGRSGKLSGNGSLMNGGSSLSSVNSGTRATQHDFVNNQYVQQGKMPIYEDGDAIYVLNTGFGDNRPDLGEDELGNKLKFDGHGGYYHKSGGAGKGEYQKYVKQNKQGPDTDAFFDQVMPVVMAVAQATFIGAAAAPAGAALGGTTAGATAGTVVPTLGANVITGALTGAGTTALSQATSGQGFDLTDIAVAGLKGGVGGATSGMISDYASYAGGGFETGAIEGAGNAFVSGAMEGEFDLENIAYGGLIGGGIQSLKDGFNDVFQTDDIADLARQELGKPEWNYLDMTDAQIAGMSPEAIADYATRETAFGEHIAKLHKTTDFGKLFGEEGLLNKMGFDTEYLSTAPISNTLEFLATPFNVASEFLGGDALYAPSAAGDKWDEAFRQEWFEKTNHLYGEAFADTYYSDEDKRNFPEHAQALEDHKRGALEAAMGLEEYLGYNSRTGEYENSNYDLVGMAQSQASNQDLDFFRDVNYIDPDNPDHRGNLESQDWVDGVLSDLDAGSITEGDALNSLNSAADYNFQQNVRYDERFSAWAPRSDSIPWTHIQETDPMAGARFNTPSGNRPGRIDYLKDKVTSIPKEAANFIGDVEGMLSSGAESWSDAINIVTDAYDAWESGASGLSDSADFESYMEQNLQASNSPNELYANLGVDPDLTEGSIESQLPEGDTGGEQASSFLQNAIDALTGKATKDRENAALEAAGYPQETVLPNGPPPNSNFLDEAFGYGDENILPQEQTIKDEMMRRAMQEQALSNQQENRGSEDVLPIGNEGGEGVLPIGNEGGEDVLPNGEVLPLSYNDQPVSEVLPPTPPSGGGGGGGGGGGENKRQQKAEQDNYMIDKELYRLARITQIISLSEGDLASVQKRMAVLREQKEAIAGDIVGAVQKKSGRYIKQTYEEDGRGRRTRNA